MDKFASYAKRKNGQTFQSDHIKTIRDRNYPFFLFHMLMFGGFGFYMAYAEGGPPLLFVYAHGGFATLTYTAYYFKSFGREEMKWLFINSALGVMGIYAQINAILEIFGKSVTDYHISVHVIPFFYYVLYTFLIRQLILDIFSARDNPRQQAKVQVLYVIVSTLYYSLLLIT